jgi:hypothetical protein
MKSFWLLMVTAGLLASLGLPMAAQSPLSVGVKGGLVRMDAASPPVTAGPYLELRIPGFASVESGLLLKGYDFGPLNGGFENRGAVEVPVLLKKRIGPFPVQPFLSTGATLHKQRERDWRTGFTLGGGVTFNALLVKIEPELRWSRYGSNVLPRGRNQTELLVGIRF